MKVYLAGPMRGIHGLNVPAFDAQAEKLREQGHEVFNPADLVRQGLSGHAAMAQETSWICLSADAIALMYGWQKSSGARAEKALAAALGLWVMELT